MYDEYARRDEYYEKIDQGRPFSHADAVKLIEKRRREGRWVSHAIGHKRFRRTPEPWDIISIFLSAW